MRHGINRQPRRNGTPPTAAPTTSGALVSLAAASAMSLVMSLVTPAAGPLGVPRAAAAEPSPQVDTSANMLLPAVHTDIAANYDDAGLRLLFHTDDGTYWDPATTIVEVPETARQTIPAASGGRDYKFMGPVGSHVWILPQTPVDGLTWLGWSAESKHIPGAAYNGRLNLRLEGVSDIDGAQPPGDLILANDFTAMGNTPMFSTYEGLPHAVPLNRGTHKHLTWAFTDPGTYCVEFTIEGHLADGTYPQSPAVMTFVVGQPPGLDPTQITTCAQAGAEPSGPTPEPTPAPADEKKIFHPRRQTGGVAGTNEYATLRPSLANDALSVALIEGTQVDAGIRHAPEAPLFVIDSANRTSSAPRYYAFGTGQSSGFHGTTQLHFDTTRLDGLADDTLTWTLDAVRGPGHASLVTTIDTGDTPVLSNRPEDARDTWTTRTGTGAELSGRFYDAGIYCLDLTWTATPDGAPTTNDSTTLRFAVAVDHPEQAGAEDCGKTADEYNAEHNTPVAEPTTITADAITQTYGQTARLRVSVAPNATGHVDVWAGSRTTRGTLSNGTAVVTLPAKALAPGRRTVKVDYAGVPGEFAAATGTATVNVIRADAVMKVKPVKATVRRGEVAAFRIAVASRGVTPGGKVSIEVAGKTKTVKLNARGKARVWIRLPRSVTPGRKAVRVSYRGDRYVATDNARTRIRVIR